MASDPRNDPYAQSRLTSGTPLGGTRDQAMQRLRLGLAGLIGMVIIVGLATIIYERANESDAIAVPEAAPTTEPTTAAPKNDPLADAGVVPDLPVEPTPDATRSPGAGQGNAAP